MPARPRMRGKHSAKRFPGSVRFPVCMVLQTARVTPLDLMGISLFGKRYGESKLYSSLLGHASGNRDPGVRSYNANN